MKILKVSEIYLVAFMLLLVSCRTFYQHGKSDALYDIEQGKLKICRYGDSIKYENEIEQIFMIQYNVSWIHFAKENLTEEVAQHCDGYTKVMEFEIRKRFGEDIFLKVSQAGADLYAYRNKPVPTPTD